MSRKTLCKIALFAFATNLAAQLPAWQPEPGHLTLPVWAGTPPESKPDLPAESGEITDKDHLIAGRPIRIESNVSTPTMTVYAPKGKNTGAAVVVFPGGGYYILAIDLEGSEVCDWLSSAGVTCVLLKYRVPGTGPYPKASAALDDAQRAMGLVRLHAAEWHIDPKRVGVLGFSAGGHLAAALSTHYDQRLYAPIDAADKLSCRPDFTVLVYPGYLNLPDTDLTVNPDVKPTDKTPPTYIVQAEDDKLVVGSVVYFLALREAKVPAELHVYAEGGHGFGLRHSSYPVTAWPKSVEAWLGTIGILPPS